MSYWKVNAYWKAKQYEKEHPRAIFGETFTFGKYKGQRVEDIIRTNTGYVTWALKNVKGFILTPDQAVLYQKYLEWNREYNNRHRQMYRRCSVNGYLAGQDAFGSIY